jgi:hypothetical protein
MKSPRLIAVVAFLTIGLAVLFDVSSAPAQPAPPPFFPPMDQPYHMQPPFFAPKKCSLYGGLFYLSGGAEWRRLLQVELKIIETQPPGFTGNVFGLSAQALGNEAWGPTFEAGYQAGDFFDLFTGFSWYSITDPVHRRLNAFDDLGNLDFLDLTYNLNFTVNEFRSGGRSWIPLFGIGRMGVTLGVITSYIPYQIDVNRIISDAATGAVIDVIAGHQADYWIHFAAFGGIDVELGFSIFFVRGSLEGSIGSYQTYEDTDRLAIETRVNPSAMSLSATGGIRF